MPTLTLPIIDIHPYLVSTPENQTERLAVSKALHEACRDYGFFYLKVSDVVSKEEADEVLELGREFFALPHEQKDKISLRHSDKARGYQRLKENVTMGKADNHEGIDFYKPVAHPDKSKVLQGDNQWPDKPEFRISFEKWVEKMKKLGMIVMEAMSVGLGMTQEEWSALRSCLDDSFWVMRIIGYPPLPKGYDGFSCGAHKDYGCLTFVHADDTKSALQVLLRSDLPGKVDTTGLQVDEGGVWINADPIPGHVVCNVGEMIEIWTNGLYKSTLHRVMHLSPNYRVSIPFFFEPNFDALVKPLDAAQRLTEKNVAPNGSYSPVVYGDFLRRKVDTNFNE